MVKKINSKIKHKVRKWLEINGEKLILSWEIDIIKSYITKNEVEIGYLRDIIKKKVK